MKLFSIFLLILLTSVSSYAQDEKFYSTKGTAVNGYDVVAYFLQNKAVEGSDIYSVDWSGSKWKFVSQSNLDIFKLSPEKYAPQYGGFCAYGTSENHLSPTDPTAWTILNDKLYLNYNSNVKQLWTKDTASRIKAADSYWPALKK